VALGPATGVGGNDGVVGSRGVREATNGSVEDERAHHDGRPSSGRLCGFVPGEFGLRWVTRGREGGGLGGQAQGDEQAAGQALVRHERRDAASSATGAGQDVLGEGVSFTLHLVQGIYPLALGSGLGVGVGGFS